MGRNLYHLPVLRIGCNLQRLKYGHRKLGEACMA